MMFGSSAKITLIAGIVLVVVYGGNTAMGTRPSGTRSSAAAATDPPSVAGFKPPATTLASESPGVGDPSKQVQKYYHTQLK